MKIPKGLSESVNQRRIDNTMNKRKRTNNNLVNTTQTTKDRVIQTPLKTEGERQSMLMLPMIQFIISVCRLSHQRKLNK